MSLSLVGAVLSLAGCKGAKARADQAAATQETKETALEGVTDETIKIAQVGSFTGPQAGLGTEVYRGAMAWLLEVNSKGGIQGRKIEILPIDDKYSADGAEAATESAVNTENPFMLFGATGTEPQTGVLKALKKYDSKKISLWGTTSGAESSREGDLANNAFNLRASLNSAGKDIIDAYAAAGLKKIGIVTQDDGFGKSASGATHKAAEAKGLTIVLDMPISKAAKPDGTIDAREIVAKMRAAGADSIVLAATYNPSSVFIRDARESGWNVPAAIMGSPDPTLRFLVAHERKTGKRMTNAVLGVTNVPPISAVELPAVREYRELMDKRNPRVPAQIADANYRPQNYSSSSLDGFVMARVLTEALERAGKGLTRESFRRAAESISGWDPGVGQRVTFGAGDNQGFDSAWLPGVKNDDFVLITDMRKYLTDKPEPVVMAKDDKVAAADKSPAGAVNAKAAPPAAVKK